MVQDRVEEKEMSTALQNRNKDPYNRQQPIYVDDRGRQMVNPGLDGDVYSLVLPPVAVGANKVFMDLFNGSTDKNVEIQSIVPVMSGAVAVTGTLAVNIWLTRTSAVGTGGTAATAEGANIANPTVSKLDPASPALPATITMRSVPGGGATAGAVLSFESQFSEAVSYTHLRAHETPEHLVCRLLLEKKKKKITTTNNCMQTLIIALILLQSRHSHTYI